jgi:hypothetical protein
VCRSAESTTDKGAPRFFRKRRRIIQRATVWDSRGWFIGVLGTMALTEEAEGVGVGGLLELAAARDGRRDDRGQGDEYEGCGAGVKSPRPIENQIQQGAFTRSAPRRAAPFMGKNR